MQLLAGGVSCHHWTWSTSAVAHFAYVLSIVTDEFDMISFHVQACPHRATAGPTGNRNAPQHLRAYKPLLPTGSKSRRMHIRTAAAAVRASSAGGEPLDDGFEPEPPRRVVCALFCPA